MSLIPNINSNNLLPLYYLTCDNKKNNNHCGLLSSVIFSQMYLNNSLPNNYMNIFNLAAMNKFLNNGENKDTTNSLLNLMYFQNMLSNQHQNTALIKAASSKGGSKLKNKSQTGGQQLNDYISEVHEFIRNGNHEEINNQGGGSKKNIEDMLVFGGAKNKKEDSISAVSEQSGGQSVCPSSFNDDMSQQSSDVQSYSSIDYSYNTYDSASNSQTGGRVMSGCLLGDTSMSCSDSVPTIDSPMNLGNALNMDSLTKNGGSSLVGSSISSMSQSNGEGMESQSVWSSEQMSNNLSTQSGGSSTLEGSSITATSASNGEGLESQSVWSSDQMSNNLSTQSGGKKSNNYNTKMEFKKKNVTNTNKKVSNTKKNKKVSNTKKNKKVSNKNIKNIKIVNNKV